MLLRPIDSRPLLRVLALFLVVFGLGGSQSASAFSFDHDPPATGIRIRLDFSSMSGHRSDLSLLGAIFRDFHHSAATQDESKPIFHKGWWTAHDWDGGSGHWSCDPPVVPEPATAALLLLGLGGLRLAARKRSD